MTAIRLCVRLCVFINNKAERIRMLALAEAMKFNLIFFYTFSVCSKRWGLNMFQLSQPSAFHGKQKERIYVL